MYGQLDSLTQKRHRIEELWWRRFSQEVPEAWSELVVCRPWELDTSRLTALICLWRGRRHLQPRGVEGLQQLSEATEVSPAAISRAPARLERLAEPKVLMAFLSGPVFDYCEYVIGVWRDYHNIPRPLEEELPRPDADETGMFFGMRVHHRVPPRAQRLVADHEYDPFLQKRPPFGLRRSQRIEREFADASAERSAKSRPKRRSWIGRASLPVWGMTRRLQREKEEQLAVQWAIDMQVKGVAATCVEAESENVEYREVNRRVQDVLEVMDIKPRRRQGRPRNERTG